MPALAIDTATEICSIAVGGAATPVGELNLDAGRSHLEMLLPGVHRLLGERSLELPDLDGIVVGTGPGTFSGLRVGIATARALAQALEIPLAGSSSLEALARGMAAAVRAPDEPGGGEVGTRTPGDRPGGGEVGTWPPADGMLLLPLIDARRSQVFAQLFTASREGFAPASAIMCLDPEALVEKIPGITGGQRVMAAGNGALAYRERLQSDLLEIPAPADSRHALLAACHLHAAPGGGFDAAALLEVLPVYVREPDADKTALLRKKDPWR